MSERRWSWEEEEVCFFFFFFWICIRIPTIIQMANELFTWQWSNDAHWLIGAAVFTHSFTRFSLELLLNECLSCRNDGLKLLNVKNDSCVRPLWQGLSGEPGPKGQVRSSSHHLFILFQFLKRLQKIKDFLTFNWSLTALASNPFSCDALLFAARNQGWHRTQWTHRRPW